MATLADTAWRDAAMKTGYIGLPYDPYDPITEADAEALRVSKPEHWPKVRDLVKPEPAVNRPFTIPASPTPVTSHDPDAPGNITNPGAANPVANLGPDPNIGAPLLETTPTAHSILKPIFDLLPGFSSFTLPSHSAQCPVAEFDALGESYIVNQHCVLAEQNKSALQAVMAAVWVLVAAFIVLRA